ncbi:MAG TPA: hypothetical protein VGR95_06230 [Thermoanaerobaculia bacterium]|nr:hypothetical protein [Thermoanaerobaculia bacterium]
MPDTPMPPRPPAIRHVSIEAPPPAAPELPPSEPSAAVPTLSQSAKHEIEQREHALATELRKMWTTDPEQLVNVVDNASMNAPVSPSVSMLLAIAHAETNGQILDVSEAGAVGLAQATPVAIRQENMFNDGKMFVTTDYVVGSRAYIMKKPLGDADTIASLVAAHDTPETRAKALRLLDSAFKLRREGVDELALLEIFASDRYPKSIEDADQHNLTVLQRLKTLLKHGSRAQLRAFRDKTRREYRALKQTQVVTWARYQHDLIAKRDRMLEQHFHAPAKRVWKEEPYEAGEYLGDALDVRFSATKQAAFLVRHLERKAQEAKELAGEEGNVNEMTAALYNGGSHNVKRMLAGLIVSLPETQRYMKKVPATARRLELAATAADTSGMRTLR